MPHINIKHFPISISREQKEQLVAAITDTVVAALGCEAKVISIALEPVVRERWHELVYMPEIVNRRELLCKLPSY